MNCPVCATALTDSSYYEGRTIHSCTAGHGTFLTTADVAAIIASRADDQPDDEEAAAIAAQGPTAIRDITEAARPCPVCSTQMVKMNYAYESGVIIDSCREHGMWVDAGELDRMQAWVEGSEKLHASEGAEWQGKLDEVEHKFDEQVAAENRQAYGHIGGMVERVSLWWYRRDDRSHR